MLGDDAEGPEIERAAMALLHDRYELIQALGSGGAGQTWVATDTTSGEKVTVKELRADLRGEARALLEREARMLGQLDHPQIPRFVEAFVEEVRLVPRLHLVLSYIEGVPLSEELASRRLTQEEALATLSDLLGIVAWLHQLAPPVVHRDIKPSNVIRRPDGSLALIDFGLATDAVDRTFMHTMAAGTIGYQAPEQIVGEPCAASDVYSVGVVAVELFTRASPRELLSGQTLRWERQAAHLPRSLRRWLSRALAPDVADRFPDAKAARDALPRRLAEDDEAEELPALPAPPTVSRRGVFGWASAALIAVAVAGGAASVLVSAVVVSLAAEPALAGIGALGVAVSAPILALGVALGRVRQVGPHELLVVQRLGRLLPPQRSGRRLLLPLVDREAWLPLDGGQVEVHLSKLRASDGGAVSLVATARVRVRSQAPHLDAAVQRFVGRAEEISTAARGVLEDALRASVAELRAADVVQDAAALEEAALVRTDRDLAAVGLRLADLTVRQVREEARPVARPAVPAPMRASSPATPWVPEMTPRWWVERPDGAVEGPLPEVVVEDLLYDGELTLDSPVWSERRADARPLRRWRPHLAGGRKPNPAKLAALEQAAAQPGYDSWREIKEICAGSIDADAMRDVYLPRIGAALARWPDARRSLDWGTADDAFRLEESPGELELVRTVKLTGIFQDANAAYRGLMGLGRRNRIRVLDASSRPHAEWQLGGERFAELTRAHHLTAVRVLRARHADLDAAALEALRDATFAPGLRELDVSHNAIGGALPSLLANPAPSRLRALGLAGAELVADDVAALAHAALPLEALDLDGNPALSDAALAPLAKAPFASSLRRLSLGGTNRPLGGVLASFREAGARLHGLTVRGSPLGGVGPFLPLLEQVRELAFEHVEDLGDADARALAEAGLGSLEWLDVDGSPLTATGLRALLGGLPALRRLTAPRAAIRDADADALTEGAPLRRHLGMLMLSENAVGARTLSALVTLGVTLDELHVDDCGLGADALAPLLDGALFGPDPENNFLDLGENPIGDAGVAALVGSPLLEKLSGLRLSGCGLTDAAARALAASAAPLTLDYLELEDNALTAKGKEVLLRSEALSADLRETLERSWRHD